MYHKTPTGGRRIIPLNLRNNNASCGKEIFLCRRFLYEWIGFIYYRVGMSDRGRHTGIFQGDVKMTYEEYYDLMALAYEEEWRERKLEEMFKNDNAESE